MGTDSVKLFDKAIGDRILAMDHNGLVKFLGENSHILDSELTLHQLKSQAVFDFAFDDKEILLDYWGCYAHVFSGHPAGSISSLEYLPNEEEETFLLLRAEHVEQMVRSLREHMDDLRVMREKDINQLDQWKEVCTINDNYRVAYLFDF
jgi:hypothetical protein